MAAHAQSGVEQSILSVCLSVSPKTCRAVICLKRRRTAMFESSESLFLLSLNGRVGAIPT